MTERDELLAALQQTAIFAERLLDLSRRLYGALDSGRPLTTDERAAFGPALDRWEAELAKLRDRSAGCVEPSLEAIHQAALLRPPSATVQ